MPSFIMSLMSLFTTDIQVNFGFPFAVFPFTAIELHFFTQSSSDSKRPDHFSKRSVINSEIAPIQLPNVTKIMQVE